VLVTLTSAGWALRDGAADIPGCLQDRLQLEIPTVLALRHQLVELAATVKRATEPQGSLGGPG
jgi:hypothetical protein